MSSKPFAVFLAIVLVWAGFSTREQGVDAASTDGGPEWTQASVASPQDIQPGSINHHHLDDQPSQGSAEHLADMPGLVAQRAEARPAGLGLARRLPYAVALCHPPFLDTLQRPPSPTGRAA